MMIKFEPPTWTEICTERRYDRNYMRGYNEGRRDCQAGLTPSRLALLTPKQEEKSRGGFAEGYIDGYAMAMRAKMQNKLKEIKE